MAPGDAGADMAAIVSALDLRPHPEGGWYRETWRDAPADESRGSGSAIYYLLPGGRPSAWHRVDAAELWHFYAGDPLELFVSLDGKAVTVERLGPTLASAERPQLVVPPGAWQRAQSRGAWTLVGCTVSPAFRIEGFELARPGERLPGR